MRALVTPFLLGCVAFGAVLVTAALAAGVLAQASGWGDVRVALGPLVFVAFERSGETTATTFGPGLAAATAFGGVVNALGAALLHRRS